MDNEQNVTFKRTFYSTCVKRILDIIFSGIAIIILSPLLLIICFLELKFHGKPILYKTKRPGKNDSLFNMYKFRSMTNETGTDGYLLPEAQRLTNFGKFIRKTSIDELPELFNILKGEMSIVGPRPLLVEYLDLYSDKHRKRNLVKPGLACFRITSTESKTWTWGEQFDNDIWYVEHVSFITDVRMIIAIFKEVFKASNIRSQDTRVPFDGTNLYETRSKEEIKNYQRYDSISKL